MYLDTVFISKGLYLYLEICKLDLPMRSRLFDGGKEAANDVDVVKNGQKY